MAIQLTHLPAPTSPSDIVSAILAYDLETPEYDGPIKELIVRAAALGLFDGAEDALSLIQHHSFIELTATQAVLNGKSVPNAVVQHFITSDLLGVREGESESDAAMALAGVVADVFNEKHLTIKTVKPPKESAPVTAAFATPDIAELDLMSEQFETLRVVLTRTLASVRPDLYAEYRKIKDSGTATARADAYQFAFGILASLIAQTKTTG